MKGKFAKNGYPDMGNGKFASKLTLEQWTDFNNAQRVHYNYLEGITLAVVLELVAGLFFPKYAALCGVIYMVGRFIYGYMYISKGASFRAAGTIFFDIALVAWLSMSGYGCFQLGGGMAGLMELFSCC